MRMLLAMLMLQAAPAPAPDAPMPDEVVVTGRRGHCTISIANRLISTSEFRKLAGEWKAGRPVAIIVPIGSDTGCEAKIMFRLAGYGVRNAVFIER